MHCIQNQTVVFKGADEVDLSLYKQWMNDFTAMKYLAVTMFPFTGKDIEHFLEGFAGNRNKLFFSIFTKDDQYIGNITFSTIDWINRKAQLGLFIGAADMRGKGYGSESIRLLCQHGFGQLNLHKVTAGIVEGNEPSIRAFEKVGFKREGEFRESRFLDGRYVAEYQYGLLQGELT